MMKLSTLFTVACAGTLFAGSPAVSSGSAPKVPAVVVKTIRVSATAFRIHLIISVTGQPDSILTRATNAGALGVQISHRLPGTATRDSFTVAMPAIGATMTGTACAQTKRRSLLSLTEACKTWSYTNVDAPPPPPVIDTVYTDTTRVISRGFLFPESKSAIGLSSWTMCMIYQMGDGHAGYRGPRDPECDLYRTGLGAAVTVAQQAVLDSAACTSWRAVTVQANGTTLVVAPITTCSGVALAQSGVTSGLWRTPNLREWHLASNSP
jgi:hypothetical protein